MKNIANFLFEAGMLKRTPRSGFQFLGTGAESVAEHIFRTTYIGYSLGRLANERQCRPDDQNVPVPRSAGSAHRGSQLREQEICGGEREEGDRRPCANAALRQEIRDLLQEFNEGKTEEARLARDADQLEMILALKEYKDVGNKYAEEWLQFSLKRLQTEAAKELAGVILETDSSLWWFSDKGDWWVSGGKR